MEQWPSGSGAGFLAQWSQVQNCWVAPSLTQSFILKKSILCVLVTPGNLMFKSKLSPHSAFIALRWLNPIHKKGPQSFLNDQSLKASAYLSNNF